MVGQGGFVGYPCSQLAVCSGNDKRFVTARPEPSGYYVDIGSLSVPVRGVDEKDY